MQWPWCSFRDFCGQGVDRLRELLPLGSGNAWSVFGQGLRVPVPIPEKGSNLNVTFIALVSNAGAVATHQTDYRSQGVCHADAFFSPLFHQMLGSTYFDYKLFANLANDNVVFVTRLKDNAVHTHMARGVRADDADGKWGDHQIQFTAKNALATGCVEYRVVQRYDEDSQRWFEFLKNDRGREPEEIAQLYRDRW